MKDADRPLEPGGAWRLVVHNRYLLWFAGLMILAFLDARFAIARLWVAGQIAQEHKRLTA